MPADTATILTEVIKIVASAAVGFFLGLLNYRIQSKRNTIRYATSRANLLRLNTDDRLMVSVDKSALTGLENDRGTQVPVSSAESHTIQVKNAGNQETGEMQIRIELDPSARIIHSGAEVKGTNVKAGVIEDQRNLFLVDLPYLNARDTVNIRLISALNTAPDKCNVYIKGKGIVFESRFVKLRYYGVLSFYFICAWLIVYLWFGGAELLTGFAGWSPISPEFINFLGGSVATTTIISVDWPVQQQIIMMIIIITLLGLAITTIIRRHR